jgi:PAS domain S-box-containing protein
MRPGPGSLAFRVLHGWCAGAAFLTALVGLVVLIGGWILGVEALAVTKRATAICFALAGAVLWVLGEQPASPRVRILADAATALVVVLAATALGGYVTGSETVGRMAPLTSACFLMLGLALLSVDRDRIFPSGQRLAVASGFVALLGVSAWAYGAAETPARTPLATDMRPLAGVLLVVLSIAVTAARPGRGATGIFAQDTAGGMVARWVVPGTIAGSLLIGALGLAGERAGLYGREFGAALTTVASLSLFSALVWLIAVRLHRTDARRLAVEHELRRFNAELEARVEARTLALTRSEARYRRVIEESPDGIMIHQDGVVRFLNPAGLRMFGLSAIGQALGLSMLDYIAPEHREAVAARVAARLRGEPSPNLVQVEAVRPDGSRFWIGAAATVVDWEGSPAILVSFVDVTEQRRLQAAEQEAESLRAVAKLANAAAHEINNPLTVVGGNVHLLAARLGDRPDLQRYFDRALRGVQSIADMISHMTRITRLTPLSHLDTGGIQILDLRGSSAPAEPAPPAAPAPTRERPPGEPTRPL